MSLSKEPSRSNSLKDVSASNRRIAKNTVILYFRMIIVMLIGLYTSRIVLNTLGVVDYGIYSVVGGPVAIFGFLNVSMASSTQRFLNFELGKNNWLRLRYVFMMATYIHALISIAIIITAETFGLWMLMNKMTIPVERMNAAFWSYQISVCSTVIGILCTPYNAAIIAHERMGAFAYISIIEVSLKLLIVFLIQISSFDKLVFYASLLFGVQLLLRFIYGFYCKRNFDETTYRCLWNKKLFKKMSFFAMWNLWGNAAAAFYTEGLNILLNMFFGPVVNAAKSIASTVLGQTIQFAGGFMTAVNPQITKLYAQNNLSEMHKLVMRSCRFSCFLILIFAVPVIIEAPFILKVWLKLVPDYTVIFLRISFCVAIIDSMARPLMTAASATGRIKKYNVVVGGVLLLIVLIAYIVLKLGGDPVSVYLVQLTIIIIAFFVRLIIVSPLIKLPIADYLKNVVLLSSVAMIVSIALPVMFKQLIGAGIWQSLVMILISFICTLGACFFLGLDKEEKLLVKQYVGSKLKNLGK